ncbi:DUF5655 domain-containing protein [Luteimonas vadosa]
MPDQQKALDTQLANIQKKTGKTLAQLRALIAKSGLQKHGQIRDMLKSELGLGHGDANTLAHVALDPGSATVKSSSAGHDVGAEVDRIYSGPKAGLRSLHDAVMARIAKLGPFEVAPKKAYLSLRRKKQFAMVGPATKTQLEIGLNLTDSTPTERLLAVKQPAMCSAKVRLADAGEIDDELIGWIRQAYEQAG